MADSDEEMTPEILALPHPRYRRPVYLNYAARPNSYYKIELLEQVRTKLISEGGDELLQRFKTGPFGHIIGWKPGSVHRHILHSILSRCIYKSTGLWFHINGQDIEYTARDHALITGLRFGESNFDPTVFRDPAETNLCQSMCNGVPENGRTLQQLFNKFKLRRHDKSGDILLRLAHLLIANIFILGHDAKNPPLPWLWALVDDAQLCQDFPWGAYTYKTLRYYVRKAKDKQKYHIFGPVWALIVWGLEVIHGFDKVAGVEIDTRSFPRCRRWGFLVKILVTEAEFNDTLENEGYRLHNIVPEIEEHEFSYYATLLHDAPLHVRFHRPGNPFTSPEEFPVEVRLRRVRIRNKIDSNEGSVPQILIRKRTRREREKSSKDVNCSSSQQRDRRRQHGERVWDSATSNSDPDESIQNMLGADDASADTTTKIYVEDQINALELSLIAKVKADVQCLRGKLRCVTSHGSPSVRIPHDLTPRVVSPRRASEVEVTEVRNNNKVHEPILQQTVDPHEPVFADTDKFQSSINASHPKYTQAVGESETVTRWAESVAKESTPRTAINGQGIRGDVSSLDPGSCSPFQSAERFDFDAAISFQPEKVTTIPDHITFREVQVHSPSDIERRQRAASLPLNKPWSQCQEPLNSPSSAPVSYAPSSEPSWPEIEVEKRFDDFLLMDQDSKVLLPEDLGCLTVEELLQIITTGEEWSTQTVDRYMMTLRARLTSGKEVYPELANGGAIICNCHVMDEFKTAYLNLKRAADHMKYERDDVRVLYIQRFWEPPNALLHLIHGHGVPYKTHAWWKASSVILPWIVRDRFIVVVLKFRSQTLVVHDPLRHTVGADGREEVQMSLQPLLHLLPMWLIHARYWQNQQMGFKAMKNDWSVTYASRLQLFESEFPRSTGAVACMTIERLISGCPDICWGKLNIIPYRRLAGLRIFSYGKSMQKDNIA